MCCMCVCSSSLNFFFFFFGLLSFFVVVVVAISWAAPAAYGGSQARGWIGAEATGLCQSHSNADPYTTAHGNAGSLTHWARAGTEPATSWFLVGFVNHFATTWTPSLNFLKAHLNSLSQSSPEIMSWFKGW